MSTYDYAVVSTLYNRLRCAASPSSSFNITLNLDTNPHIIIQIQGDIERWTGTGCTSEPIVQSGHHSIIVCTHFKRQTQTFLPLTTHWKIKKKNWEINRTECIWIDNISFSFLILKAWFTFQKGFSLPFEMSTYDHAVVSTLYNCLRCATSPVHPSISPWIWIQIKYGGLYPNSGLYWKMNRDWLHIRGDCMMWTPLHDRIYSFQKANSN